MIKIFDNNGATFDRYTVLFLDQPTQRIKDGQCYNSVSMSFDPTAPNHCAIYGESLEREHLGREIGFNALPYAVKKYMEKSDLINPTGAKIL